MSECEGRNSRTPLTRDGHAGRPSRNTTPLLGNGLVLACCWGREEWRQAKGGNDGCVSYKGQTVWTSNKYGIMSVRVAVAGKSGRRGLSRNGFVHQAGQKHGPDQIHHGECGEEESAVWRGRRVEKWWGLKGRRYSAGERSSAGFRHQYSETPVGMSHHLRSEALCCSLQCVRAVAQWKQVSHITRPRRHR